MSLEEQIEKAAVEFWKEMECLPKMRPVGADKNKPGSLWLIENYFANFFGANPKEPGGCPISQKQIIQLFGAYLGEVVNHHHNSGCKWVDAGKGGEIELHLPDGKILSPMKFVKEQIRAYKPESFVNWGKEAGLKFDKCPKRPTSRFRP